MPNNATYNIEWNPSGEALERVSVGLYQHNTACIGERSYDKAAIYARDDAGAVIGGIFFDLIWEWLHIEWLWVEEAHRGEGLGGELLARAEALALERGITRAHLETTSFQAPDFYRRHGYVVFGEIEKPPGHRWFYMKKDLEG
jgi:GNAT superfamily N-acetyltransferase